ncbi:hypothetical protein ACVXHA_02375 [Escherichia coli]
MGGVVYHGQHFGFVALPCRFLQIGDKSLFQTGGSAFSTSSCGVPLASASGVHQ